MTTNLEKFNEAKSILDSMAEQYVLRHLGIIPESLWKVGPPGRKYEPEEWRLNNILYHPKGLYFNKHPSRKIVKNIQELVNQPLDPQLICLHLNDKISTVGCHLKDLEDNGRWSLDKNKIKAKTQKLREVYITKENQFNCRYCRKATDNDKLITRTVIARQYPNMRAEFNYCSEQCASYDQMAHEG